MATRLKKEEKEQKLNQVLQALQGTTPREYQAILNAAARKRPWRPRRTGWANVLDQLLHAAYGALLLLPVLLFHSFLGAALLGLLAGGIREIEQYFNQDLKIRMVWDRVLDTGAFVLGAVTIFLFFHW